MNNELAPIQIQEAADGDGGLMAQRQREQFDRNSAWLQAHVQEIYARYRGMCICVAGQELFVADTASEAVAQAQAAHPEDGGWFTRYIPKEKVARVYAL